MPEEGLQLPPQFPPQVKRAVSLQERPANANSSFSATLGIIASRRFEHVHAHLIHPMRSILT